MELKNLNSVLFSFLTAFVITLLYLPSWIKWIQPQILIIVLFYWSLFLPSQINVFLAWLIGIILDITYNTILGVNSFGLVLAVYLIIEFAEQVKELNFFNKLLIGFCLFVLYQLPLIAVQYYLNVCFNVFIFIGENIFIAFIWACYVTLFSQRKLYFEKHYK